MLTNAMFYKVKKLGAFALTERLLSICWQPPTQLLATASKHKLA